MRRVVTLATALALVAPAVSWAQTALTTTRVYVPQGTLDGISVGDTDGDGVKDIALISRGGTYSATAGQTGTGTLALVKVDGTLKWEAQSGEEFVGYPAFINYDSDAWDEVAACESWSSGKCYIYDNDGTLLKTLGPFNYPGMTNSGPSVADVNGDKVDDIIIHSYAGTVTAFSGSTGAAIWQKDFYALYNELFFGHSAIKDVDNDGTLEIVLVGYNTGALYVINAENGTVQASSASMWATYGNVAYGSGAAIANLDSDTAMEFVSLQWSLTAAGGTPAHAVIAFDTNGAVLWRRVINGANFAYMSPVITDVDRSNGNEVYAQSNSGTLYVLDKSGNLMSTTAHSTRSWTPPAFLDVNLGGSLELLLTGQSGYRIVSGTNPSSAQYTYSNSNAMVYPQPVQTDVDGDGKIEIITGAWNPKQALFFDMDVMATYFWGSFSGDEKHPGSIVESAEAQTPERLVTGLQVLRARLDAAIGQYSGTVKTKLQAARTEVTECMRDYIRGAMDSAAGNCREAVTKMNEAVSAGLNISSSVYYNRDPRPMTIWIMLRMLDEFLERTYTMASYNNADLVTARTNRGNCMTKYNASNFSGAAVDCENGIKKVTPAGNNYSSNLCSTVVPATSFTPWICVAQTATTELKAIFPAAAVQSLASTGISYLRFTQFVNFTTAYDSAEVAMGTPGGAHAAPRAALSEAVSRMVFSLYLDAVQYSGSAASGVTSGKALWDQGETARNAGDFVTAAARYKSAALSLVP